MNYVDGKKFLRKLLVGIYDDSQVEQLLDLNNVRTKDELITLAARAIFFVRAIRFKNHILALRNDIKNDALSDQELELMLSVNDFSSLEEMLWALDQAERKISLALEYKRDLTARRRAIQPTLLDSGRIDFLEYLGSVDNFERLARQKADVLKEQIAQIDSEEFCPEAKE